MNYRTGKITEVSFDRSTYRIGDTLDDYTIAEMQLRVWGDAALIVFFEQVGEDLHSRRMEHVGQVRWINFDRAEDGDAAV